MTAPAKDALAQAATDRNKKAPPLRAGLVRRRVRGKETAPGGNADFAKAAPAGSGLSHSPPSKPLQAIQPPERGMRLRIGMQEDDVIDTRLGPAEAGASL
jgi:hypothetical protein